MHRAPGLYLLIYIAICLYCLLRIFILLFLHLILLFLHLILLFSHLILLFSHLIHLFLHFIHLFFYILSFYFTFYPSIFTFIFFKPSQFLLLDVLYVFFMWVIYFQVRGAWWQELQNSHLLISLLHFTTANSLVRRKVERY